MRFFLGTHVVSWLWDARFRGVPLFVSAPQLRGRASFARAVTDWACDSGGFSSIFMFGRYDVSAAEYVRELADWNERIGRLLWAAPQDWMCEEIVCASAALAEGEVEPCERRYSNLIARVKPEKRTPAAVRLCRVKACLPLDHYVWRRRVAIHQCRTVENLRTLRLHSSLRPCVPIIPVLQGVTEADYLRHVSLYRGAGIDLRDESTVGVGSVCRRQGTEDAARIIRAVASLGIRPHGFGFKLDGIRSVGDSLASADSLAWSYAGRKRDPLPGCRHGQSGRGKCNNCPLFALDYFREFVNAPKTSSAVRSSFGEDE